MGALFGLYNFTKRERVKFSSLSADKAHEIACSHEATALAVWYCFRHRGDLIAFVSDYEIDEGREFFGTRLSYELLQSFTDTTEETIAHAVAARVFIDKGWFQIGNDPDPHLRRRRLVIDDSEGLLPSDGLWPSPAPCSSDATDGR